MRCNKMQRFSFVVISFLSNKSMPGRFRISVNQGKKLQKSSDFYHTINVNETAKRYIKSTFFLQTNRLMHVALLCVTYSLRLALRSAMATEPLFLVVNLTAKSIIHT